MNAAPGGSMAAPPVPTRSAQVLPFDRQLAAR
jgi:hypothetical protein